jgi:hypothetical protein
MQPRDGAGVDWLATFAKLREGATELMSVKTWSNPDGGEEQKLR